MITDKFGFIVMDGWVNPATSQPNVAGLILGGSAGFKTKLSQSEMFDPPLQAKILNIVDVSYGGENGFNKAIELFAEILSTGEETGWEVL